MASVYSMDVLSEVLKAVKLDGAVFFHGEFSAPWCMREPDADTMASYLSAASKHVIIFHLLTEAGVVWNKDLLNISYYSSHEGRTAVYFAKVKLNR